MEWYDDEIEAHEANGAGEDDQLPCPSCGRMIFEDSERCPHCGDWVMPLAAAASGRSTWVWWTALILAVVMIVTWGLFG